MANLISFDSFVQEGNGPIYQQILLYLKRGIAAGRIGDGDELPSRRVLSARLGVNPNTVQKAYRLLEEEGLIQSHAGAKSYMALDEAKIAAVRGQLLEEEVRQAVAALKQLGLDKAEALALMEQYWQ